MEELLSPTNLLVAMPFIFIGINQMLKSVGLDSRWSPLVNVILGFLGFPIFADLGIGLYYSLMGCLILGLSAGGFYDFGKRTVLGQ